MPKIIILWGGNGRRHRSLEIITARDPFRNIWVTEIFPNGESRPIVSLEWGGDASRAKDGHRNIQETLEAVFEWLETGR